MASALKKDDMVVVHRPARTRARAARCSRSCARTDRVIVEGVDRVKRHTEADAAACPQGGIIEKELPIHVSKVMLLDPKTDKPTRVRSGSDKDGKKVRVAVKTRRTIAG